MNIAPIKTKHDYERALLRIEHLMDAKPATKAGDELDVLLPSWRLTKPSIIP